TRRHRAPMTLPFLLAFLAGAAVVPACPETSPNPLHCFNAYGDATCAGLSPDKPFCVGPGSGCGESSNEYGCAAELPSNDCYSPCGQQQLLEDDDSCLM